MTDFKLSPQDQAYVDQWKYDLKHGPVRSKAESKTWLKKELDLIERFKKLEPLKESFELCDGVRIIDPVKFHAAMASDIAAGPSGPRSITGAFQADLEQYVKIQTVLRKLAR